MEFADNGDGRLKITVPRQKTLPKEIKSATTDSTPKKMGTVTKPFSVDIADAYTRPESGEPSGEPYIPE